MTAGSVEPLRQLHARFGDRVHFVDVLIRQAHPGPGARPYTRGAEKALDAERFQHDARVVYPVLVDDVAGTTHQVYGSLADPTYVVGADGLVSFYNLWTHGPTLHRALEALLAQGGTGTVRGGRDRAPHLLAAVTAGWPGLRRGVPQSVVDLELAMPGSATAIWLGDRLRRRPIAPATRVGLALAAGVALGLAAGARRRAAVVGA